MPVSVPTALAVVRRCLADEQGESCQLNESVSSPFAPPAPADPHARILPAFRETWRGGPNPLSADHGSCFVPAECIWRDRNRLALHFAPRSAGDCGRCDATRLPEVTAVMPCERDEAHVLREAALDSVRLRRSCRKHYPHGALGLQENPYGHAGEIYAKEQHLLSRCAARTNGPIKGQPPRPEESLIGSIVVRQSHKVRAKGGYPPQDHLHGAVFLDCDHVYRW